MSGLDRDLFFDPEFRRGEILTYADISIYPAPSEVAPFETNITGSFARGVELNVPMLSAAMDSVTTAPMAIALAKLGAMGIIHASMGVEEQYKEVRRVKNKLNGLIENPITFVENLTVGEVLKECDERGFDFRTFPVVDSDNKFKGLVTQNDFDFCLGDNDVKISDIMTNAEEVFTGTPDITTNEAFYCMKEYKKKTLPLLDTNGNITGMYILSDVVRKLSGNPENYSLDDKGRLRVGAAVSTDESALERVERMKDIVDVIVVDTAQGDGRFSVATVKELREAYPNIKIVAGNVSNGDSAKLLADLDVDGVKVGQGPGSICSTRRVTGMGVTQATAIFECEKAIRGSGIPICADGGIVEPGDVSKAIALGASSVMMGRMLAGAKQSPGELILEEDGRMVKIYRGMASMSSLLSRNSTAARNRYGIDISTKKPLAEGVESKIPYTGPVEDTIEHLVAALRKSFSYVGSPDLETHRTKTKFGRMSNEGKRESSPHNL